ncbi:MAG: ATP-binding cassette domain-containing protein [Lachnospiraceae bacterium]|nr:ATP-binding cassette domain-containing protein [Lachnospiraceae bacterium]MBR5732304.1 ATP-binding cassette domain-containing protein [Lachnospiraceae bacterium]
MKKLNRDLVIGMIMVLLVSIPVVISIFWLPYNVNEMDYGAIFQGPSIRHIFGTDNFGRDIFCRVIEGARSTFLIALFTVMTGAVIGGLVGALTGYYGGVVDEVLMRLNDGLASFPSILLALVVVSILDKGTMNICISLGIVFIPSFARIMRSEFLEESSRDYVANAKLMGASDLRIIFVHILPNTMPVFWSSVLVGLNNAVLAEAGLSYLGLGVQPPDPSLGRMLAEAQVYIYGAPWYMFFTSLTMVTAILGISLISGNVGVSAINFRQIKKKVQERRKQELAAQKKTEEWSEDTRLSLRDLHVGFIDEDGVNEVIKGISFDLKKGEILGIVGESGSGKSLTALSILGIASDTALITGGDILLDGQSLADMSEQDMTKIRGGKIAMIFQEPMTSLNPVKTIGWQIDEILELHASHLSEKEQKARVLDAMADTGLEDPDRLYGMYPHELSGGMRQRVMIAMALVARAGTIFADEPTTALDADIVDVILGIFKKINRKYGTSIILISHDLEVIASICGRALVLKDGMIVEELEINKADDETVSAQAFVHPQSAYGQNLLSAAFADKSYLTEEPEGEPIVELTDFSVMYRNRGKFLFSKKSFNTVNKDVNMTICRGDCVGIVGPSGCGKTTLVKAIAGLQQYTKGQMKLNCERPGMVFQDPLGSLNPSMTVGRILEEPLRLSGKRDPAEAKELVAQTLRDVELDEELVTRKVSQLSGGQRQRVSIALNIILNHELIILDEPVSALDVTIREQVLELLMRLKKEKNLTFIIISHDRRLVSRICNKVYNMEDGHAVRVR